MLKTLYVKNYVLIDEIRVEFGPGLNIITGETGAGKSIIVGALGALLGDSLGKDLIRANESKAVFEAEFELKKSQEISDFCREHEIDVFSSTFILRRELNETGRSRCFINDSPVTIKVLSDFGDMLVDLHGQHQHQQLLKPAKHILYLDAFADNSTLLAECKHVYQELRYLHKQKNELLEQKLDFEKTQDLLSFQLHEINSVDPQDGEDEALHDEERLLNHAETLYTHTATIYQQLYEKKGAVSEILDNTRKQLMALADIDASFSALLQECENAKITVDDISDQVQQYNSKIVFNPDRLDDIRQRLAALNGIKKKYGPDLTAVLQKKKDIESQLNRIDNVDEDIEKIENKIKQVRQGLAQLSLTLSDKRKNAAEALSDKVTAELAYLGMEKSKFQINIEKRQANDAEYVEIDGTHYHVKQNGIDFVEFLVSTNPGEALKPLAQIASGGEISRIMLALKSLLADADHVPVLVFDEIDSGISGRVAQAAGVCMRKLADDHQIFSITHLPQIASMAQHHYLVSKSATDAETKTSLEKLSQKERQEQIARLLGGEKVTEAHLSSALDLMNEAESLAMRKS